MKSLLIKVGLFVGLLMVAMLTAGDWQHLDRAFYAAVVKPADAPDRSIYLLEVPDLDPEDARSTRFRAQVGQDLVDLVARRPARVVLDIQFDAAGASLAQVLQGVEALARANIPVFLAVDPGEAAAEVDPNLYGRTPVAGVGHTVVRPRGSVFFFEPVETNPVTGKSLDFLPLLVAQVDAQALPRQQVVRTPPVGERALGGPLSAAPASLRDMTVIVASSERECRVRRTVGAEDSLCRGAAGSHAWSGPELLVWALTDLLQPDAGRHLQPVHAPTWLLLAALLLAATACAAHEIGLRWLGRTWSPTVLRQRLGFVAVAALLFALAVLMLAEWLLMQLHWLLPPTFSVIAAALAVLLCHLHAREHLAQRLAAVDQRATDNQLKADVDVFISYSHAPGNGAWVEREIVEPLKELRLSDGRALRLFFDRNDIRVGQRWFSRINLSILGSRCFLCVWSEDYMERDYCRWELEYAFPRAARTDFLFLPVARVPSSALAGPAYAQYLQSRQYIDALNRQDFIEEVLEAVTRHLDTPAPAGLRSSGSGPPA